MNYCNFYMSREDAKFINNEVEFVSGKSGLPEERVIELMKIMLLSSILSYLEHSEGSEIGGDAR